MNACRNCGAKGSISPTPKVPSRRSHQRQMGDPDLRQHFQDRREQGEGIAVADALRFAVGRDTHAHAAGAARIGHRLSGLPQQPDTDFDRAAIMPRKPLAD